jgi:hypothetical protein
VVPLDLHEFFSACATVAGALIGLLFVAISVAPEKLSDAYENVEHQIRAGAAFTALVSTLIVSLFALIPRVDEAETVWIVACVGLAATLGLLIFFLRSRDRQEKFQTGQMVLILVSLTLYSLQLVNGILWDRSPHDGNFANFQAEISIVFFIVAIARAWELVGARDTGLFAGVAGIARERRRPHSGPGAGPAEEGAHEGSPPPPRQVPPPR